MSVAGLILLTSSVTEQQCLISVTASLSIISLVDRAFGVVIFLFLCTEPGATEEGAYAPQDQGSEEPLWAC